MMKRRRYWLTFATALPLLVGALPLRAQKALPVHLLAAGGPAFPGGNDDELRTGYQAQLAVEAAPSRSQLSIRVEGLFDHFGSKIVLAEPCPLGVPCPGAPLHEQRLAGTVDLVVSQPAGSGALLPYLIAGGGAYWHRLTTSDGVEIRSGTDFGANAGAGVRISHVGIVFEARAHLIRDAGWAVPLIVGFRF